MGCDIHSAIEVKRDGSWKPVPDRLFPMVMEWQGQTHTAEPFEMRSYGVFGFLADVRNYSHIPPLSKPREFPEDISAELKDRWDDCDFHSRSWLGLRELLAFDYDGTFEDRRCMKQEAPNFWNGAADAGQGNGRIVSYREFLGKSFFRDLEIMRQLDPEPDNIRIVFCFDN